MAALVSLVAFTVYLGHAADHSSDGEEHAKHMSTLAEDSRFRPAGLRGADGARVPAVRLRRPQRGVQARRTSSRSTRGSTCPGRSTSTRPSSTSCSPAILTIAIDALHRQPHAGAAEPHPDRGRDAVRPDARQHHAREHGRQDGGEVVPVHRCAVPVHLVQQPDRLHPAADRAREVQRSSALEIPTFAIYAATANVSVPLVLALVVFFSYTFEGIRAKGFIGYLKSLIPAGVHGWHGRLHLRARDCCRT